MSAAQIRFFTLSRREVNRFMKIKKQTIGAPLLETFLYISVFGAALGSRIDELHGIDYVVFVIPGLIMMAWAINAFSNNSSSILQQKFQGAIQDQLSSPASPLELLLAFSLGGFMRGLVVAVLTFTAASFLVDLPVDHILVLIPALFLVGFFFAQLGVLIGVRAEQFDDVAIAQTFVLQPLIFLGGVFYSAVAAARAVRDPDPLQPGLLHDRPGPLRLPRLRRGQRGAVAARSSRSRRPPCSRSTCGCSRGATSCGPSPASSPRRQRRERRGRTPSRRRFLAASPCAGRLALPRLAFVSRRRAPRHP